MKLLTTRQLLVIGCILTFMSTGCGSNEDTLDEDIYERPEEAQTIVSNEQLERFESVGMKIYSGSTPPSIEATYYSGKDIVVEYKSREELWVGNNFWCDSDITYKLGDKPYLYTSSGKSRNCDSSSESTAQFISGKDSCFTLYSESSSIFEGCATEKVRVYSACLNEKGDFLNPQSGGLTLKVEGNSCAKTIGDGRITDVGDLTITRHSSGLVKRTSN